jgi:hypothetical protein
VGHLDANGKVTVAKGDEKHTLTFTETYEPGHADPETKIDDKGTQRAVVGSETYPDFMYANPDQEKFAAYIANPQNFNLYAYVLNNPLNKTDPTGMYQCAGTAEQCAAIRVGLADIRAAAANLKVGTSGRAALDKVLAFYGAENTNNGVKIDFNNPNPNAFGSTSTANGVTTISFGANALTPLGPTGKGENVAHEGTHGVDQKASGHMPHTFWQLYDTEYHAYQAESAVDKGVGSPNETDPFSVWFPGITPQQRTTNITKDAYLNACADVGNVGCP